MGKFPGLLQAVVSIIRQLKTQREFLSQYVSPILDEAREGSDGTLHEQDFKKINKYYGLAVPAILGEAFCVLRGKPMTAVERMASTCQGAMTGLFDDFFDNGYLEAHHVEAKLTIHHEPLHTEKSNERLFTHFYSKALSNVEDRAAMQQALFAVHEAQVKSKKQTLNGLGLDELEQITEEKGGTSLLFYRTAFHPAPSVDEQQLLYQLGATMQIANDIFDVYKDREQNIRTLMTEATSVNQVRGMLLKRISHGYDMAYSLPMNKDKIRRFLSLLSMGIFSRCFVCLDQLEKNERLTNGRFEVNAYSREQLICDMDTKKNMLRSAAYHIKTFM